MDTICTDHRIESTRDGLCTLLRNKRRSTGGRPVLFIHGATYPSTVMFDYPIEGRSWLDWMAEAGFDPWCIDLLGYGLADRPPELSRPAEENGPIVDTAEAVKDVRKAVDFILAERNLPHLDLVGYSWGTAIAGQLAGEVPAKIGRLVLGGAIWLISGRVEIAVSGKLGAYRTVTADAVIERWTRDLDERQTAAVAPPERLRQWADVAIASDPLARTHQPPRLRAPSGVVKDVQQYWMRGTPTYDPALIEAPTLIVVGEWDVETTPAQGRAVFDRLAKAAERRYTVIGGATHSMLLENQRRQLYATVAEFLGGE